MAGRSTAVANGTDLKSRIVAMSQKLGLEAKTEVRVARRIWGAEPWLRLFFGVPDA
jgi:hypothetical protein